MSYRVRFTTQTGDTGYWRETFATRAGATMSAAAQADMTGYTYAIEEVPDEPTTAAPDNPAGGGAPTNNRDSIHTTERLVGLLRQRHAQGLAKYGVTVDRGDLTPEEWAQHAIEELLDGAAYLMRLMDTMAKTQAKESKP